MTIVELAAYVIIGEAAGRYISRSLNEKRKRIERSAVEAEYEVARKERQQHLLMRYPDVLVRAPDRTYFNEAAEADRETHPSFVKNLKNDWWLYVAFAVGILVAHFFTWPSLNSLWDSLVR